MSANVLDLEMTRNAESQRVRGSDFTDDQFESTQSAMSSAPVICYRDPADVRMIRRQSRLLMIALVIVVISALGVVYKAIQKPDRIVVDMTSGRTVMINDRELGATEAVKLEREKLEIGDQD